MLCVCLTVLLNCLLSHALSAQVTFDSNAVLIGASASSSFVQDTMTLPAGTDRILVVFVMRDGSFSTATDSITHHGEHLTNQFQQSGNQGVNAEIWYLALGCGSAITDTIKAYFSHSGGGSLPDVVIAAATFQHVDQFVVFGDVLSQFGQGSNGPSLNLNTTDATGLLIGTIATDYNSGMFTITPTGTNQIEIYEAAIPGNNNSSQGSVKATTGGTDVLSWAFSNFCNWASIGVELLASDQDGDGVADCNDLCPTDSLKTDPGICGCGVADIDTDNDGTFNCDDLCPMDSLKIAPGICGCGVEDVDSDNNGLIDCIIPHVIYDSNSIVIGAIASTAFLQDQFTIPEGIDRLLVAFVTRDGFNTVTDSITFNGQYMTNQFQQAGNAELNTEIWYLALGCGPQITDSIKAHFSHVGGGSLPDVIVGAASFQFVDQSVVFGGSDSQFGQGGSSFPLNINNTDTSGLLIGTVSTDVTSGMITISPNASGQNEIFEGTISGNNNSAQGSVKTPTGSTDDIAWLFSNSANWTGIGAELLVSDQDGDGVFDCNDFCPNDSLKTTPGICGCGIPDIDSDGDGTVDCNDLCPADSLKIAPGFCGCGVIEDMTDTDSDGIPDCADLCPLDSLKSDPGICGCGVADIDTDGDGTVDCLDVCPNDSTLIADIDSDGDGVVNCQDLCPFDPLKVNPGSCGCGISDIDSDLDGIPDCSEQGDVLLFAGGLPNTKGPTMQGIRVTPGGDTTWLWSLGNRSGLDYAVTIMQHRNDNLHFGTGNLIGMTIDPTGRLGLGIMPTSNQLKVNGNASKSTPGNWLGNSDARLKKNIITLDPEETLSKLLMLRGVTYVWNDTLIEMHRPQGIQYGLLAQDIQKIFPQLVLEDSNGYLQTSYGTFDPMILEGIRYIDQETESMQVEVNELMRRMGKLENALKIESKSRTGNE